MIISAKIIADSITSWGERITTFELEYHRFVHAELMTHRLFSRNAASSRAIPIKKMIEQVLTNPAIPVYWGLNQKGMQAAGEHKHPATCEFVWNTCAKAAVKSAEMLDALGLHKQIANRVLEPYQVMKTIVTATTYDNFFWLRCHKDAQPEIHTLAEDFMYAEYIKSSPTVLQAGEWHLPYVNTVRDFAGTLLYTTSTEEIPANDEWLTLEDAKKVSASCCAQVSYRVLDDSLEKALGMYDDLVTNDPVHASPFEHLGTPMEYPMSSDYELSAYWEDGVTHMDRSQALWSGNFKGWIQYRQLIDNNVCEVYSPHIH